MFGILISALNSVLVWLFKSIVIKFVFFTAIYLFVSEAIPVLQERLPVDTDIREVFAQFPDSVWYFANLMMLPYGIKIVLSAWLTRFIIRRIPLIG
ncbi:DUF2523 domain-containing protein [Pectobacterium sp. A535-S3-A17]|uniref:DUF2523 family protein n=1 Tax=Pectobacterium TaxID=122277 RepID=UPI0018769DD2|nr:DUF2523 family protein [Pectobacterium quasiaquaticum]MBE5213504.1 DUF2523 domain-containing protein [Pectobacterium quasiaquaticum]MBE5223845.1 DUF2523 domain-containing protein [Pectobacterium quasiaquaticum]